MVCDCWKAPEDSVSPSLAGRNNILHGSRFWKSGWQEGHSAHYHSLTTTNSCFNTLYMLSKHYFLYSLYAFKKLKSSSTWFNPCFSLRRAYLLLYVESVYPLLSILEANTCVNFVHHFLYACVFVGDIPLGGILDMAKSGYLCWIRLGGPCSSQDDKTDAGRQTAQVWQPRSPDD